MRPIHDDTSAAPEAPKTVDGLRKWLEKGHGKGQRQLGKRTLAVLVHMLEDPHAAALRTISQIAEEQGVDPSTLTRLGQSLGFNGFAGLQQVFRQHVRERGGFYSDQAQSLLATSNASIPALVRNLASEEMTRFVETVEGLRSEDLDRVTDLLVGSSNVYVMGLRATYSLAFFFSAFLRHLRPRVHVIGGPHDLVAELAQISPQDVLVAFSFRPYTTAVVEACEAMRARDVPLVAVTDIGSPMAVNDAGAVTIVARSPFYFNAAISSLFVTEVLVSAVAQRLGSDALEHIENLETLLNQLNVETP